MADFFQIGTRDIAMTCTNIVLKPNTFKAAEIVGAHTQVQKSP